MGLSLGARSQGYPRFLVHATAGVLLFALVLLTYLEFGNGLNYDEAIYLTISKSLVNTGVPYRSSVNQERAVFTTSPPLVTYVASLSQRVWPCDEFPSRVVHLLVFALPCYLLVWHISRKEFGDVAACVSLAALLGTEWFLWEMGIVHLDGPLALLSLLTLWAFSRASRPGGATAGWSLLAAAAVLLAMWTKYQAICIAAGIVLYLGLLAIRRRGGDLKRAAWPLAGIVAAGVLGLTTLYAYFCWHVGLDAHELLAGLRGNMDRTIAPDASWTSTCFGIAKTLRTGVWYLGGYLVMGALLVLAPGRARWRLPAVLFCFCVATVLFNLWAFRMPGGGRYYLLEMAPALAILAGRPMAVALSWPDSHRKRLLRTAVVVLALLHVGGGMTGTMARIRRGVNRAKPAAQYVKEHCPEGAWLLSDDVALEFYTGRPTGIIQHTVEPVVSDMLEGKGKVLVTHVALPRYSADPPFPKLAKVWSRYWALLEQHFEPVPLGIDGMVLLERKHPWPSELLTHRQPNRDPSTDKRAPSGAQGAFAR